MTERLGRWLILLFIGYGSVYAASLRYLGDVELGMPGVTRTSVTFGRARAVLARNGSISFQGQDDEGKPWKAALDVEEGVGFTTVWQADFDHNWRQDLLIAAEAVQSGHCVDEVTLSFLLFDRNGQPVPWIVTGRAPWATRFPYLPALFGGFNGQTEFVLTDCSWFDNHSGGVDRSITGIYHAKDAMWRLVRPDNLGPYDALVRHAYRLRRNADHLLPTTPVYWLDRGNSFPTSDNRSRRIVSVIPRSSTCSGAVHLPPVVDGRLEANWKDPCDDIGKDRLQLSDGTICYGWPTVMLDRNQSREIVAESEIHDLQPLLQQIEDERMDVVLAGQKEPGRCSPVLLWARAPK